MCNMFDRWCRRWYSQPLLSVMATTAFILILAYRIYEEYGTVHIRESCRLWG
ncbi:MAG: hypothetical protein R2741_01295 [Methanolobus sp.]